MNERVPEVVKGFDKLTCEWTIPILGIFVAIIGLSVAAIWWMYTGTGHIPDFSRPASAPAVLSEWLQLGGYLCAGLALAWSLLSLMAFVSLYIDGDWAIWDAKGKCLYRKS